MNDQGKYSKIKLSLFEEQKGGNKPFFRNDFLLNIINMELHVIFVLFIINSPC